MLPEAKRGKSHMRMDLMRTFSSLLFQSVHGKLRFEHAPVDYPQIEKTLKK
jgi:hypothetical protein